MRVWKALKDRKREYGGRGVNEDRKDRKNINKITRKIHSFLKFWKWKRNDSVAALPCKLTLFLHPCCLTTPLPHHPSASLPAPSKWVQHAVCRPPSKITLATLPNCGGKHWPIRNHHTSSSLPHSSFLNSSLFWWQKHFVGEAWLLGEVMAAWLLAGPSGTWGSVVCVFFSYSTSVVFYIHGGR